MHTSGPGTNWRRFATMVPASLAVLVALVALRGPDAIGESAADSAGAWLLAGHAGWNPLTVFGGPTYALLNMAGPRGWQNAHVIVAWLAVLCWFRALPADSWRGLGPLAPALWAVVLSGPESGWNGFGMAVLVMSAWEVAGPQRGARFVALSLPAAAWLSVWLSPGAMLMVAAAALAAWSRLPRRPALASLGLTLAATLLTPRGPGAWPDAVGFVFHTPQPALAPPAVAALLFSCATLALSAAPLWRAGNRGAALAPVLLFLSAASGQTAFLWPAALRVIPAWPVAVGEWRRLGFRFRWFMQTATIVLASGLAAWQAKDAMPRWYALAMTEATVLPSLTRESLPEAGDVYVNPRGLALARLSGPLPAGAGAVRDPRLGREPSLWRARDRAGRHAAVWLLGEKSDYAPLARHLGESPDWRLAAVDATGLLFLREPRTEQFATEPAQQEARGMWGGANRSAFLSGAALSCLAAGALPEAGELAASAVRNSDLSAPAAAARARVLVSLGDVRGALVQSARAVALDPTLPVAWETRSEALLHAGMTDDAYAAAQRTAELAPGDPGALWLAARAAQAARAFQTEAVLLERLVALTEARGGDAAFYRLYLGQSYAKQGLARPALRELERAAAAPGLTAEQRTQLEEELGRIRAAAGAP